MDPMPVITEPKPLAKRTAVALPVMFSPISAGFPSPAEGEEDGALDLNELMVTQPHSTFFAKVKGDSMKDIGIMPGSIVVIDRSRAARDGDIIAAWVEGNWAIKRYRLKDGVAWLVSENVRYKPIQVSDADAMIWGVVRWCCHQPR